MSSPRRSATWATASPRAIEALRAANLIACDDTRTSRTLLARHAIPARTVALHEHNERATATKLLQAMHAGKNVALISDAGTPAFVRSRRAARRAGASCRYPRHSHSRAERRVAPSRRRGSRRSAFSLQISAGWPSARRKALDGLDLPWPVILYEAAAPRARNAGGPGGALRMAREVVMRAARTDEEIRGRVAAHSRAAAEGALASLGARAPEQQASSSTRWSVRRASVRRRHRPEERTEQVAKCGVSGALAAAEQRGSLRAVPATVAATSSIFFVSSRAISTSRAMPKPIRQVLQRFEHAVRRFIQDHRQGRSEAVQRLAARRAASRQKSCKEKAAPREPDAEKAATAALGPGME